jgi:hypothetical protein
MKKDQNAANCIQLRIQIVSGGAMQACDEETKKAAFHGPPSCCFG